MLQSNLRFVPWKNRETWLRTYEDAYSEDHDRQISACQTMELWLVLRNDVPPGVECTLNILSAMQQENQEKPRKLQLILSTAVLRVVNMLCDSARQSEKETIYSIAKYFNLPDWIVNLRHDVSHGSNLPALSSLKRAAIFLLAWLKEYYWEVEKEHLNDIILKRSRFEACKYNVEFFMTLYTELSELLIKQKDVKIKMINNDNLKLKLADMSERCGFKCAVECVPWVIHSKDSFAKQLSYDEVSKMKMSELLILTLTYLKDYVTKIDFWEVDVLPFIFNHLSKHFATHQVIVREIWGPLVQKLNKWNSLGRALNFLSVQEHDDSLIEWNSEIFRALVKRHLADKLRSKLSKISIEAQDADEQACFAKAILRKQLELPIDANDSDVLTGLFNIVEKKNSDLKKVLRLSEPINYIVDSCFAVDLIKTLVIHPNQRTISSLQYLLELSNPDLPTTKKELLNKLLRIGLGKKLLNEQPLLNNINVKTVKDLMNDKNQLSSSICNTNIKKEETNTNHVMNEDEITLSNNKIVRSGWNFSKCPLGISPWKMEGIEYYHKPYNSKQSSPSYVFPVSKRPKLSK